MNDTQAIIQIAVQAGYTTQIAHDCIEISKDREIITAHLAPSPDEPDCTDCLFSCSDSHQDGHLSTFPTGEPDANEILECIQNAFQDNQLKPFQYRADLDSEIYQTIQARSLGEAAEILKRTQPFTDLTLEHWKYTKI